MGVSGGVATNLQNMEMTMEDGDAAPNAANAPTAGSRGLTICRPKVESWQSIVERGIVAVSQSYGLMLTANYFPPPP